MSENTPFTATQAAQKKVHRPQVQKDSFTATQAAQKFVAVIVKNLTSFTATQAAQKMSTHAANLSDFLHRHIGGLENE